MGDEAEREAAWGAVHDSLPARWRVASPPSISDPLRGVWSVTAVGPHPGRGRMPESVTGTGEDETSALRSLDDSLRGIPKPDGSRMDELRRRLRLAYVAGAEEWTQAHVGRQLTAHELERVIARFRDDDPHV